MRSKKIKILPVFVLLFTLLITLACYAEGTQNPKSTDENAGSRYILSGTVTDTWSWGPDTLACDAQDEMKLTIGYDDSAILRVKGPCYQWSGGTGKCIVSESDLSCGIVIYGTYNHDQERVTFTACNDPKANNGSGEVTIEAGSDVETFILHGSASCTFANSDEQHTIQFAP